MIGEKCDNLIGYIMTSEEIENQNISNIILDIVISFIILLNLCLINLSTLYYLYSHGISKLLYIKGITQDILDNEFSTFAIERNTSPNTDQHYINIPCDESSIVPKRNIALPSNAIQNKNGLIKTKKRNERTLHKNESKKRPKTTTE